jgi:hypothetical protein
MNSNQVPDNKFEWMKAEADVDMKPMKLDNGSIVMNKKGVLEANQSTKIDSENGEEQPKNNSFKNAVNPKSIQPAKSLSSDDNDVLMESSNSN